MSIRLIKQNYCKSIIDALPLHVTNNELAYIKELYSLNKDKHLILSVAYKLSSCYLVMLDFVKLIPVKKHRHTYEGNIMLLLGLDYNLISFAIDYTTICERLSIFTSKSLRILNDTELNVEIFNNILKTIIIPKLKQKNNK